MEGSDFAIPDELAEEDFCYLSTTGRITGRRHTIEIWFAAEDDVVHLLAGSGRSDWVRNLVADPAVEVRIDGRQWGARARVVGDRRERDRAAELVHSKYAPRYKGDLTAWRDTSVAVAVRLLRGPETGTA